MDLRSAITKEAGKSILVLAQSLGNDFDLLANKLISKDSLIKVLHNGNKVLAEVGFSTMESIICSVCIPK